MCDHCDNNVCTEFEGHEYCDHCLEEYTALCSACGKRVLKSGIGVLYDEYYCSDCIDNYDTCCCCGGAFLISDMVDDYCESCWDDNYFVCSGCGCTGEQPSINGVCTDCIPLNKCDERRVGKRILSKNYDRIKSSRWYGVEIETSDGDYDSTSNRWGITDDCSISGMEIVSPLLQGDEGLESIGRIYDRVKPSFDGQCGLHVHIDVRDLDDQQLFDLIKAFKTTKDLWFDYVDRHRRNSYYCRTDLPNIMWGETFTAYYTRASRIRNRWVNLMAIRAHGSIELRLHEGTANLKKVQEWVARIVNFAEDVVNMSKDMPTRK